VVRGRIKYRYRSVEYSDVLEGGGRRVVTLLLKLAA
jgi:hypothetical protein